MDCVIEPRKIIFGPSLRRDFKCEIFSALRRRIAMRRTRRGVVECASGRASSGGDRGSHHAGRRQILYRGAPAETALTIALLRNNRAFVPHSASILAFASIGLGPIPSPGRRLALAAGKRFFPRARRLAPSWKRSFPYGKSSWRCDHEPFPSWK